MAIGASLPVEWAADRLALYRSLQSTSDFNFATFIDPLLLALPFRLGESAAEASFPFAFDDDFADLVDRAVDDLVDLLRRRREAGGPTLEVEGGRRVPPPTYSLGAFPEGTPGLSIASRVNRLDPALDSGLVEAWVPRGHGGPLLDHLVALYTRLRDEDQKVGAAATYVSIGVLGTLVHFEARKSRASSALVSRLFPLERVEKTLGCALFALVEAAVESALGPLADRPELPAAYAQTVRALLCPLALCTVRERALQNELNPWGLSETFAAAADRIWLALLEERPDPRAAEQRLITAFEADPDIRQRAAQAGAILAFRRRAFDWLGLYDGHDPELSAAISGMVRSDAAIFEALSDPKAVVSRVHKFAKTLKPDPAGEAATAAVLDALRRGPVRDDLVREVGSCYSVLALDRVAVSTVDRARARLKDRRAEYSREQLVSDYLSGRLYRLSADGKPIRRALIRRTQGHLFIDLKGFTQRTYRAKEIVMAEFLRSEFYEPILNAAARHVEGPWGDKQIILQNLLGDAAVFSGEMPALVELARDIQKICRAYAEKLRARSGVDEREVEARGAEVETRLNADLDRLRAEAARIEAEIEAKRTLPAAQLEQTLFGSLAARIALLDARRHEALQKARAVEAAQAEEAVAALRAREKELFGRIENLFGAARDQLVADLASTDDRNRLKDCERRAAEARRWGKDQLRALDEERRATRGGGLEAGLFITWGANAEIAATAHPLFGPVKVAIAEKINEAARGTARNAFIRAKLDALLGRARAAAGNPRLELPFRVYVDAAYNLLLPADLNEMIDTAVREREPARAREAAKAVAETVLRDLARLMSMGDGQAPESLSTLSDIYNTGEALSGEAVAAYLSQTVPVRTWFRKVVSLDELDPEFAELFVFVQDALDLVVSVPSEGDTDEATLFRRAGQVQFRGFEGKSPTSVWELLRPDSPFALLLAQKHLPLWAAEARGRPQEMPT